MAAKATKEVFEQAWRDSSGAWQTSGRGPRYTDPTGTEDRHPDRIILPRGWTWGGKWEVDKRTKPCDGKGWQYGTSFADVRRGRCASKPESTWEDAVRRRRWLRVCVQQAAAPSLMEVEATLESVHKHLLAASKMVVECDQLRSIVATPHASRKLRSAIVQTASRAQAIHERATATLRHPPAFDRVRAHVTDADAASGAWPPSGGTEDAAAASKRLQKRWRSLQSEADRLGLKVQDVWVFLHSQGLGHGPEEGKASEAPRTTAAAGSAAGFRAGAGAAAGSVARDRHRGPSHRDDVGTEAALAARPVDLPEITLDGHELESEEWLTGAEIATRERLAEERAKDIGAVYKDAVAMKRLMANLSLQVGAQNEGVEAVAVHATSGHDHTEKAVGHLEAAKKEQGSGCCVM